MEYYLASLYPCEVCGTVFGFICSGLSEIISAWRQQKWLEWLFLWDALRNAHGCTCTIKHRPIIKEPAFLRSTNEIHRSCEKAAPKCDISILCQLSLLTPPPPPTPKPPPSSPPLPWAPFSRPHVSGGRLWRQQLDWAACQRCGPLMDVAGLRNNPLCVEHTAQTRAVLLKHIKWPVNSQRACSPVSYTHRLINDTREDEWFALGPAGPG